MCPTHYVKSVRIPSYSDPHFSAFRLNTMGYGVTQSKCGKMRTRITPNTETFSAVTIRHLLKYIILLIPGKKKPWNSP